MGLMLDAELLSFPSTQKKLILFVKYRVGTNKIQNLIPPRQ